MADAELEIAYLLSDSGARLLVVDASTAGAAAQARASCAAGIGFVSADPVDGADPYFTSEHARR